MFLLSLRYYGRCWKPKENLSYTFKMDDCYTIGSIFKWYKLKYQGSCRLQFTTLCVFTSSVTWPYIRKK